ncbi:MAG: flavodoxin family protein [Clostridiales bacterium]|jgi:multimeric flavodoxin WrbA|nr:flavodoxin family protein [Clostridiales bacterium]
MKTLIINGSSRKNGNTEALVKEMIENLDGEIRTISMYSNISPCIDCRYCWKNPGCSIRDDMQDIYPYYEECDNIVLASPTWFSSLSGPTINIVSRFQTYFAGRIFRKEKIDIKPKNGVIIIVGAMPGTHVIPTQSATVMMSFLKVRRPFLATIYSLDTDKVPASQDIAAIEQVRKAARELNEAAGAPPVK